MIVISAVVYKEKFILFSTLVLLLSFVGEINSAIRFTIQITGILWLAFYVIKKYGINFKKFSSVPSPILNFVILLYTALTVSILFSEFSFASIPLVLRLSIFLLIVYFFFILIGNVDDVKLYINAIIVSAIIVAIGTIYDFLDSGFNLLLIAGKMYRTGGFIGNYNAAGGYFSIAIPLLVASLYNPNAKKIRIMFSIIIGILFIALIISGSRSALLATTVSVSIILYIFNRKLLIRLASFFTLTVLVLLLFDSIRDFLLATFRVESGLTHRDHLWKISINLIKDNFLFGIGPGAYAYKMFDYLPVMINSFQGQNIIGLYEMTGGKNNAHNFYLIMFTDLGILGFICSLMLPYVFFRMSKVVFKSLMKSNNNSNYLVVGVVATISGLLVRALFDGINILSYGWISMDLPFWLMLSIIAFFYNNVIQYNNHSLDTIKKNI